MEKYDRKTVVSFLEYELHKNRAGSVKMVQKRLSIFWDKEIMTERQVEHKRPGITIIDKINNKVFLIDTNSLKYRI